MGVSPEKNTRRGDSTMPTLVNYTQFDGRYWDTGVIRNALDYQGARAPHTGEPYSEALLLGISGGVTFGYFTFHYKGYDPQVNLLTRNTFEPMQTIQERLGIPVEVHQTASADKARQTLITTIEDGHVPIVFPDMYHLPYNALAWDDNNWATMPVVCFGYEPDAGEAYVADRAYVPLTVPIEALDAGRARVKKDKHRLMVLEHPDEARLAGAVRQGIADCIALMTEKPPRGSAKSFGLKALQHWADMLAKSTKESWSVAYPTSRPLLSALTSAYTFLGTAFGKTHQSERDTYADFLDEASQILGKPELENVAVRYRMAGKAWDGLQCALLPETVSILKEAKLAIDMKTELLLEKGSSATDAMLEQTQALEALMKQAETDFGMSDAEVSDLRDEIRRHVLLVHDAEEDAVQALKVAMR
jgi:hypothetical protein